MLCMTISMGMLIFASLLYFLEKDELGSLFYSLPQALYWAIITMTSTGATRFLLSRFSLETKYLLQDMEILCQKLGQENSSLPCVLSAVFFV